MSFEQDVIACTPRLRAYGMSLLKNWDKVDDIVQDVMVKALSKRHLYTEGTNLIGWLTTILRNEVYSQYRTRKYEVIADPDSVLALGQADLPTQEIKIYWKEFEEALKGMQEDQKRSLIMIAIEGFTYEEVSDIERVAVGTIKSRVARGRAYLRDKMKLPEPDHISLGVISNDDNLRSSHRR